MRNYFIFGGIDSRDYGCYISGPGVYDAPQRQYNPIQVPGRNGDLLTRGDRFGNIEITYPAFIAGTNFKQNLANLRSALLSKYGYQRFEDSYNPEEFRQAYFAGGIAVEATTQHTAGQFDLVFTCKPQRFLKSGETVITVQNDEYIQNPTLFASKPSITVHDISAPSQFSINGITVSIDNVYETVTIDCELMDCYSGSENANGAVTLDDGVFPTLIPGSNYIIQSATGIYLTITPRWFII